MEYKLANVVARLKEVKAKRPDLTIQKISDHTGVPPTTVSRIFADGSELKSFRYESVQPIAKMLLDMDDLGEGDDVEKTYKAIVQFYETALKEAEEKYKAQKQKYEDKLEAERTQYRNRVDFLMKQIDKKDERIDVLFEMVKTYIFNKEEQNNV